jgi:rhodanese-related sulfurtransferase
MSPLSPAAARVEPDAARELLREGAVLVDVRRHDDPALVLEGAVRIPPDEIPDRLGELPRGAPILLVCT